MLNEVVGSWEDLKERILTHRRNCEEWKNNEEGCYDCHCGAIGRVERGLNEKFKELILLKSGGN